jgi:hypothetical protein
VEVIIANARVALVHAAAERAALRRSAAADRDDRLTSCLDGLAEAMAPIRARLLHAPSLHRGAFEPELRALSDELKTERRRVYEMLHRRHGGTARRPRPASAVRLLHHFDGTIKQAKGEARRIAADVDEARDARNRLRRIRPPMLELVWWDNVTKPARTALAELRPLRRRVAAAQARCLSRGDWKPGHWARLDVLMDEAYALSRDVARIMQRARRVGAARPPRPPAPRAPRRKHRSWTPKSAHAALAGWAAEHGRWPRARDLTDPDLPSYGTVHALLGGLRTTLQSAQAIEGVPPSA